MTKEQRLAALRGYVSPWLFGLVLHVVSVGGFGLSGAFLDLTVRKSFALIVRLEAVVLFAMLCLWMMRRNISNNFLKWQSDDERREKTAREEHEKASAFYLKEFVRKWQEGVHGVLFVESVSPGLRYLARMVSLVSQETIHHQQVRFFESSGMTEAEEEKFRRDLEEASLRVRKNFWDVRNGLVNTGLSSVYWIKSDITSWKQAMEL